MGVEKTVSGLKRFQRDEFGELATQSIGVATQMMCVDLRRLLVLGKVPTLVEASCTGRVHEKIRRPVQLHEKTPRSWSHAVGIIRRIGVFKGNVLDVGERILDLVTSRVIVDIVGETSFVRRIEYDQIHGILSYPTPGANGKGFAGKVVNHL